MKKYNYENKTVYLGLDVHKKSYHLTAICEGIAVKKDRITASPTKLITYIEKHFSGAEVHSAYEAGFCGFHLHRCLVKSDIQSIVVHPAAIETAANNRVKTDKRDSLKIASQLADGRLKGIYVPEEEQLDNREVTRFRETVVRQRVAEGNRIKSFLMRNGSIEIDSDRRLCPTFLKELQKLKLTEGRKYV